MLPRTQTSLFWWKCAGKGRRLCTLPIVPCGSSPVTRVSRSPCEKRSAWGGGWGKCIWAADEVRYFCPCVAYHFHALIFNFCSVHILWKILCHILAIETPKTVSARIFHNHFNDMVFGHHCLRCPQRRTLLSSRTFLLRMGSFPTGISICCLCLKH